MQDWHSLINGRLGRRNISFDLQAKLLEIESIIVGKAKAKGLSLRLEANFEEDQQIVEIIQYEQLLHSVLVSDKNEKGHPLLKYITDME